MSKDKKENTQADTELFKPSRKIVKREMSFDVYFQGLLKKNSKILPHHKAAMKKYAETKGLKIATEEEFDRIMRLY